MKVKINEQCQGYKNDRTWFFLSAVIEILGNKVREVPKFLKIPCEITFQFQSQNKNSSRNSDRNLRPFCI